MRLCSNVIVINLTVNVMKYWLFTPVPQPNIPQNILWFEIFLISFLLSFTLSFGIQDDKWSIDVIFEILFIFIKYLYVYFDIYSLQESHISIFVTKTDWVTDTAPLKVKQVCFCFSQRDLTWLWLFLGHFRAS